MVHRFTRNMLTNASQIRLDPRVQVVIDMDGWGTPGSKMGAYRWFVVRHPVQYTGFKLFYKNDKPMMTPQQVLELYPEAAVYPVPVGGSGTAGQRGSAKQHLLILSAAKDLGRAQTAS